MNAKQRGKFSIDAQFLSDRADEVAEVLARLKIVPVRAEYLYATNTIEVEALCDRFDEVGLGCLSPWYTLTISKDESGKINGVEVVKERNRWAG